MSQQDKPVQGTREWAVATVDCCIGCPHGCRYCYARYKQVDQQQLLTEEAWQHPVILDSAVEAVYPQYEGQVMFPANHDIVDDNVEACIKVLRSLLEAGNRVLVVSKAHLTCIKSLAENLDSYKEQLLFRLTITARKPEILSFWEPHAPAYRERLQCLVYLFQHGFSTSVSVEPMLDRADVAAMVKELLPFVTHSIWIGKMNKIEERVSLAGEDEKKYLLAIEAGQGVENIQSLYDELKEIPEIRWKESIKDIVGLKRAGQYGLDI